MKLFKFILSLLFISAVIYGIYFVYIQYEEEIILAENISKTPESRILRTKDIDIMFLPFVIEGSDLFTFSEITGYPVSEIGVFDISKIDYGYDIKKMYNVSFENTNELSNVMKLDFYYLDSDNPVALMLNKQKKWEKIPYLKGENVFSVIIDRPGIIAVADSKNVEYAIYSYINSESFNITETTNKAIGKQFILGILNVDNTTNTYFNNIESFESIGKTLLSILESKRLLLDANLYSNTKVSYIKNYINFVNSSYFIKRTIDTKDYTVLSAYNMYYSTGEGSGGGKKSFDKWRDLIMYILENSNSKEEFKSKLDTEISKYAYEFWKNEGLVTTYISKATYGVQTGSILLPEKIKQDISENYKIDMYTEIKPVLKSISDLYEKKQKVTMYFKARDLIETLNSKVTYNIKVEGEKEYLNNLTLKFENDNDTIREFGFSGSKFTFAINYIELLRKKPKFLNLYNENSLGEIEEFKTLITDYEPGEKYDAVFNIATETNVVEENLNQNREEVTKDEDGLKQGLYKKYENGKLTYETNYIDDIINGEEIYYHENGKVHQQGININGEKLGIWVTYDETGKEIEKNNYTKKGE